MSTGAIEKTVDKEYEKQEERFKEYSSDYIITN